MTKRKDNLLQRFLTNSNNHINLLVENRSNLKSKNRIKDRIIRDENSNVRGHVWETNYNNKKIFEKLNFITQKIKNPK